MLNIHFVTPTYAKKLMTIPAVPLCYGSDVKKVKSNYFIVRPKVDQRAGLLSLPSASLRKFPPYCNVHYICLYLV